MLECSCVFNTILELNRTLDSQNSAELFYTWLCLTIVKGWDKICNRRKYGAKVGKKAGTSWMALPPVRLETCHSPQQSVCCVPTIAEQGCALKPQRAKHWLGFSAFQKSNYRMVQKLEAYNILTRHGSPMTRSRANPFHCVGIGTPNPAPLSHLTSKKFTVSTQNNGFHFYMFIQTHHSTWLIFWVKSLFNTGVDYFKRPDFKNVISSSCDGPHL